MIWVGGKIVEDHELKIAATDRTFEHGLGLFETLRTWEGHASLLDRHRERMQASAGVLGLTLDPRDWPEASAVAALIEACHAPANVRLRITMSGGADGVKPTVWMRAAPLPTAPPDRGMSVLLSPEDIAFDDVLSRHKTLNYWSRRMAYERAIASGAGEALRKTPDGRVWSGSRTNFFLIQAGELRTPGLPGPIVPGIMRGVVMDHARTLGMVVREQSLSVEDVGTATEMFLTNAVRGVVPVSSFEGRDFDAPGPVTDRLRREILGWLNRGGKDA